MDPLSVTANVITVLQLANSIISICYDVRANLNKAPWSLTRVADEIRDLRNVLEQVEKASERLDQSCTAESKQLCVFKLLVEPENGPLARCHEELAMLEKKIVSSYGHRTSISKQRAFLQVMGWQLKESDAKACLARIDRCKSTILMALTADEATLLADIQRMTESLNIAVEKMSITVSKISTHFETESFDDNHKQLNQWLAPVSPWESHEIASNTCKDDTGKWFIDSTEFRAWCEAENPCLWLSGFPGSGKTILFSHIVSLLTGNMTLFTEQNYLSYFYCDFRIKETQEALNVVGSLVSQVCAQIGFCPEELKHAFEHSRNGSTKKKRPSFTILRDSLCSMAKLQRLILMVDAIDECDNRKDLLDFLSSLPRASSNISIIVTSRDELDIRESLKAFENIRMEHHTKEVDGDIDSYIDGRLHSDNRLQWLKPSVKEDIKQSLSSKSTGMFRMVQCTLDSLSTLRTVGSIRSALKTIPQGLGQTYEIVLSKVPPTDVGFVRRILLWLSFTLLPITLEELHAAIAIEQGLDELDEDMCLGSTEDILALCGSLLTVSDTQSRRYVQLAHLSVKDYLLSSEIRSSSVSAFALEPVSGRQELALDCFTYLSFKCFRAGPCDTSSAFAHRLSTHPFLRHAATAWTYYLRGSASPVQTSPRILDFFAPHNRPAFMSWVQVLNADSNFKWDVYPRHATPLYYAASFGLADVVRHLLASGEAGDLDAPGSRFGGTALHGAVLRYHVRVVEALLGAGASPNRADFDGIAPLHTAAAHGHAEMVRLLLRCGADGGKRDGRGETPMDWAVRARQGESQELLSGKEVRGKGEEVNGDGVWIRPVHFFPDPYARRSGMESSIVIEVSIGGSPVAA